jgi:2-C-methyl-D-erythritol 4-phosphate cytidylyltransferase / 2-C-methyl-D-erythritol 2,4-cyclodiphosphate synthase
MQKPRKIAALIVAAGKGARAGGHVPKQFAILGGKALVAHAVDAFFAHASVSGVFVVIGAGQEGQLAVALGDRDIDGMIIGGAERQDSVSAGLDALAGQKDVTHVLIHDAARPFLPQSVIDRLIKALDQADGAVPALPVVDTLARVHDALGDTVDRATLVRVQTPQAFDLVAIMASHAAWAAGPATDDAQMMRASGFRVVTVEGDSLLDKMTHAADFAAAETRLSSQLVSRTGMGFDVHRLETGEELWLGGLQIPHDKGLSGHSDADVALHALTDALLGAISAGDIGDHFPPSDPQWRGVASHRFVEHARDLIEAQGGVIDHVDLTIICEAPKIGPYRDRMRESVASMLRVPVQAVSIKATTTERLGLTGRGEGIAAQAVVTVRARKETP